MVFTKVPRAVVYAIKGFYKVKGSLRAAFFSINRFCQIKENFITWSETFQLVHDVAGSGKIQLILLYNKAATGINERPRLILFLEFSCVAILTTFIRLSGCA